MIEYTKVNIQIIICSINPIKNGNTKYPKIGIPYFFIPWKPVFSLKKDLNIIKPTKIK